MLDPATDLPDRPWCYLGKSTTVIGVPDEPDVTQLTFDGAVFTRNAELCFFYGPKDRPLLARQKSFLEGWIPVVQYEWRDGDVVYDIEYFAMPLEGETADNTVNFVRVQMRNAGSRSATGCLAAALRGSGGDCRFGDVPFSPNWRYEMNLPSPGTERSLGGRGARGEGAEAAHPNPLPEGEGACIRDGKLTYTFSRGATREAVPGESYVEPFLGSQYFITTRAECCLARYRKELKPGENFAAMFKMPRVPVDNQSFNAKLLAGDYEAYRTGAIAYWKKQLGGGGTFEFPEKCVQAAQRASVVHVLLATRKHGDGWTQTDGLPYPEFFLTSTPQMVLAYLQAGQFERAKSVVQRAIGQQKPNGLYQDVSLGHGAEIPAAHGHCMFTAAMTALYSQDRTFAEKVYPSLTKAVQYIADSIDKDPYGLLPPTYPYDNEMIKGHYTSNNLWALLGLRETVRVARLLGKADDDAAWSKLEERYRGNILKGVAASAQSDGYVPPGLYKYLTGSAAREGFAEWSTGHDWENMLLAYPGELLPPADRHVRGTVDHVRKNYAEGVMPYRIYMHQYITANQVEQYLALGDGYTALKDFYHLLLHTGSTYEGFENLVRPWADRRVDPGCPPPHGWGAAKLACLVRDLVLLEYGGQAGLEPGQRELWLFHCLSPAWVQPGGHLAIRDAPTEFGRTTATMQFDERGATVRIGGTFHERPAAYRLRVPYFKELTAFTTDAVQSHREGDCIVLSADATTARLEWRDRPAAHLHTIENLLADYRSANRNLGPDAEGVAIIESGKPFLLDGEHSDAPQPLSFATVRAAYRHEYARLAERCGKIVRIEPPAMLSAAERKQQFVAQIKGKEAAGPQADQRSAALPAAPEPAASAEEAQQSSAVRTK